MNRLDALRSVRKLVVKIGTAALSRPEGGLDESRVAALAEQIHALKCRGLQLAVISSGAIGAGMNALGIRRRPARLPELQTCAAVGQSHLIAAYDDCFNKYGYHAAQMLLTREDFNDRRRYLNASNAIHAILMSGSVPVIDENDTIAVEEITFGDNDGLASLVANLVGADLLLLLTTVDGMYENPDAPPAQRRVVPLVTKVDEAIRRLATSARSRGGSGGMASKIEAARVASEAGAMALIANAREPRLLERLLDGEPMGTLFLPVRRERMASRKRWMRFGTRPKGALSVDAGARRALVEGKKSLLPSGIVAVSGDFLRGDLVAVCDASGAEFARGLVNYTAEEMRRIKGSKTSAVRRLLGDAPYDEAIHRDHLAIGE